MAWIESHQGLMHHPKTKRLARLLGVSVPTAIGHLHCLWYWALDYAQDGDLTGYDEIDVAGGALWDGDEREFSEALVKAGFVDLDPPRIHDWMDYAGLLVERRRADAERKRAYRERTSGRRSGDVQRTSVGRPADVQRTSGVTVPNRTVPNRTERENGAVAQQSDSLPAGFEAFWAVYPNRTDKKAAVSVWRALKPDEVLQQQIVTAVEAQARTRKWQEGFVKAPQRWLKDRNWEDEIPVEPIPIAAARGASRQAATEAALDAFLAIADGAEA
jgi:hypothetical protein